MDNTGSAKKQSQSHIPIKSLRTGGSGFPNPLHSSHPFGLVSQSRHLAVSEAPAKATSSTTAASTSSSNSNNSATATASSTGGGLATFRSLRNLLPFGSGKNHHNSNSHHHHQQQRSSHSQSPPPPLNQPIAHSTLAHRSSATTHLVNQHAGRIAFNTPVSASSSSSAASGQKSAFGTISALRKSIHGERSVSAPQLRPKKSQEDVPILTIDLTHHLNEPFLNQDDKNGLGLYNTESPVATTSFSGIAGAVAAKTSGSIAAIAAASKAKGGVNGNSTGSGNGDANGLNGMNGMKEPRSAPATSQTFEEAQGPTVHEALSSIHSTSTDRDPANPIPLFPPPSTIPIHTDLHVHVPPSPSSGPTNTLGLGISDLSTILESETSGLSKHLPSLEDSRELNRYNGHVPTPAPIHHHSHQHQHPPSSLGQYDPHQHQRLAQFEPSTSTSRRNSRSSSNRAIVDQSFLIAPGASEGEGDHDGDHEQDTSALDLSTSKVGSEVLAAMAGSRAKQEGWLHGVVVDDVDEEPFRPLHPPSRSSSRDRLGVTPSVSAKSSFTSTSKFTSNSPLSHPPLSLEDLETPADEFGVMRMRTSTVGEMGGGGNPETSFGLGELDPDLAALLSPNRILSPSHPSIGMVSPNPSSRLSLSLAGPDAVGGSGNGNGGSRGVAMDTHPHPHSPQPLTPPLTESRRASPLPSPRLPTVTAASQTLGVNSPLLSASSSRNTLASSSGHSQLGTGSATPMRRSTSLSRKEGMGTKLGLGFASSASTSTSTVSTNTHTHTPPMSMSGASSTTTISRLARSTSDRPSSRTQIQAQPPHQTQTQNQTYTQSYGLMSPPPPRGSLDLASSTSSTTRARKTAFVHQGQGDVPRRPSTADADFSRRGPFSGRLVTPTRVLPPLGGGVSPGSPSGASGSASVSGSRGVFRGGGGVGGFGGGGFGGATTTTGANTSPSAWESEFSPSSRAGSSVGMTPSSAASSRFYYHARPSLDGGSERMGRGNGPSAGGGPGFSRSLRGRDRSASVSDNSPFHGSAGGTAAGSGGGGGGGSRAPVMEWLGPRTAKAFAAAGLIDLEKVEREGSITSTNTTTTNDRGVGGGGVTSRPGSRFSSARSQASYADRDPRDPRERERDRERDRDRDRERERDYTRSPYAPSSRMTFSEAGSVASSWGRRSESISRGGDPGFNPGGGLGLGFGVGTAGAGTTLTESASTPRTTFSVSGVSTAPTSVSAASSAAIGPGIGGGGGGVGIIQHHTTSSSNSSSSTAAALQHQLQNEIQTLQERHAMETGALLSALADSQRTTKVLREENGELRERLGEVEGRLSEAVEEIKRLGQLLQWGSPSHAHPSGHPNGSGNGGLTPSSSRRYQAHTIGHSSPLSRPTSRGSVDGVLGERGGGWRRLGVVNQASGLNGVGAPEIDIRVVDSEVSLDRPQSSLRPHPSPNSHPHPHPHSPLANGHSHLNHREGYGHSLFHEVPPRSSLDLEASSRRGSISSTTHSHSQVSNGAGGGGGGEHRRRYSNASSVFHVPPASMSLLLHEEPASDLVFSSNTFTISNPNTHSNPNSRTHSKNNSESSVQSRVTPPSPTMIMSSKFSPTTPNAKTNGNGTKGMGGMSMGSNDRYSQGSNSGASSSGFSVNGGGASVFGRQQQQYGHERTASLTNLGNISPTTASFSMMTGSPGSMHLRPEHERLLGDMPTLDLCAEDYEDDLEDEGG